jgi:hypothetical protein
MKRERLTQIVEQAANACGYSFHSGEAHKINSALRKMPAAWLMPPVVKSKTGRTECEVKYHIVMHLMAGGSGAGDAWGGLERDAAKICSLMAAEVDVCSIANISFSPDCGSLSAHGEVSVTVEADVTVWYYLIDRGS